MAYGIIQLISNNGHTQVYIPSGTQYASIGVLNPNDGVAYVAANRDVLNNQYGSWDWKIPSQSYALLPGPFLSVGIYYTDQSGAAHNGEITIYGEYQTISIPTFQAVGRAIVALQSTLDVTQGSQPANPGVGITRVWADTNGNLHRLLSNGSDAQIIDTSSIGSQNLGGNLTGTIANGNWNANADLHAHYLYTSDGSNGVVYSGAGNLYLRSASTNYTVDSGGTFTVSGVITCNSQVNSNTFNAVGNNYYFANNAGIYVAWNGAQIVTSHAIWMNGATIYFSNNGGIYWTWTGNMYCPNNVQSGGYLMANSGIIYWGSSGSYYGQLSGNILQFVSLNVEAWGYFAPAAQTATYLSFTPSSTSGGSIPVGALTASGGGFDSDGRIYAMQAWGGRNTGNANAFLAPNIGDNRGQGLAWQWSTWSSVAHAIQYGLPVAPVANPMELVRSITGYYYAHASMKGSEPILRSTGEIESNMTYGFAATEVNANIPEMASDEWVDTSRLIAILWEGVKELDARLAKLESTVTP